MGEFYSPITLRLKDDVFCLILAIFRAKMRVYGNNYAITLGKSRQRMGFYGRKSKENFGDAFGTIFPRLDCPLWVIGKPKLKGYFKDVKVCI